MEDRPVYLRLYVQGRQSWFEWSYDGEKYGKIGCIFDTTRFSDAVLQIHGSSPEPWQSITCVRTV
ncbi:MAG: hypothetical protein ACLR0U_13540 [Enterocloster clostridioformis]